MTRDRWSSPMQVHPHVPAAAGLWPARGRPQSRRVLRGRAPGAEQHGSILLRPQGAASAVLKDGALHPVEGTAYAFNNSAQVVALRACQIPGSSYLGSTIFPATPGGPNVDAVEVLPHFGLVGRDSSYRFTDPNQPRNGQIGRAHV